MNINEYIEFYFNGNKSDFARYMNVTPQQVTKWVNDNWIISNGKVYSPKRDLNRGEVMKGEINFLAKVLCGAEYTLAEIRNLNISGDIAKNKTENAKELINYLLEAFNENNYAVRMIAYDKRTSKYQIFSEQPIFNLGETYFDILNPGSILFIHNNELQSDLTFDVGSDISRLMSGRFDDYAYAVLLSEVRQALQTL